MKNNALKFVADESCDFAVVRGLRKAGFDVLAIVEAKPGYVQSNLKSKVVDCRMPLHLLFYRGER